MIKLIRINLLPYREIAHARKKKQFRNLLIVACIIALALIAVLYFFLDLAVTRQQARNQFIQTNVVAFQGDLKTLMNLQKEKDTLLNQKNSIEALQYQRFLVAKILNDLDKIVPTGVQLTKIEPGKNDRYYIYGRALSDNKVALFMKSISTTGLFEQNPVLNEIKTRAGAQEFKLTVKLIKDIN